MSNADANEAIAAGVDRAGVFARRSPELRAAVILLASVVAGAALGLMLRPLLSRIPNDLQRTRTILRALHTTQPHTVVFGDSVIMNGIDARQLQKDGSALNLSSMGQTISESFLYYQELPPSVTTVVQSVSVLSLVSKTSQKGFGLNPHVANAFRVYGYQPRQQTLERISPFVNEDDIDALKEGVVQSTFAARWMFRQLIDTGARSLLRHDLNTNRAVSDLLYPSPYTRQIEPWKLKAQIDQLKADECSRCDIPPETGPLIAAARQAGSENGRRFILLIAPVNPAMREFYGEPVRGKIVRAIQAGEFGPPGSIIDASQALTADDFDDALHPGASGAAKLSRLVSAAIDGH